MAGNNYRPGVYSRYDAASFYTAAASRQGCAVVARAVGAAENTPHTFSTYQKALEVFGGGSDPAMLGILRVLFRCGVSSVTAVAVGEDGYGPALEAVKELDNIGAVVCDSQALPVLGEVKGGVQASSEARRERIGFVGVENPQEAMAAAQALNCERMVVCCPAAGVLGEDAAASAVFAAAALAGTMLAAGDPIHNFGGLELGCLEQPARMAEDVVQSLLAAGVTVMEPVGEQVQIVRALTTRTTSGGVQDRSMSSLNTILIIDDVMLAVRTALTLRLRGKRISAQSRDSILAQVVVELAAKQDEGVIESFQAPKVYQSSEDPAVCVVELSFKVAHVLSQIHVVAHIQV